MATIEKARIYGEEDLARNAINAIKDHKHITDIAQVFWLDDPDNPVAFHTTSKTLDPVGIVTLMRSLALLVAHKTGSYDVLFNDKNRSINDISDEDMQTYVEIAIQCTSLFLDMFGTLGFERDKTDKGEFVKRFQELVHETDFEEVCDGGILSKAAESLEKRLSPENRHMQRKLSEERDYKDQWKDIINDQED